MGRHLWRLFRPAFLLKMVRSNAPGLYGWDILLRGTIGNGPRIGDKLQDIIASVAAAGHETGLHAWDHHRWQMHVDQMSAEEIADQLQMAAAEYARIFGHPPSSSACAGWKCNERVLVEKENFPFLYNSDCRGRSVFRPLAGERVCVPQIPVTLPTYDEIIGRNGISDSNFNEHMLSLIRPGQLNVYTIHAEVEGMSRSALFDRFLQQAQLRHIRFVPLIELLNDASAAPARHIEQGRVAGREGMVCWQAADVVRHGDGSTVRQQSKESSTGIVSR
jgi:undecaprenyl phosphate-alpha-L-ara4FN deformylase